MYRTHRTHKNLLDKDASYVTIGDPYIDPNRTIPPRWKEKQFVVQHKPALKQSGYFEEFKYQPEEYKEMESYLKSQPQDRRKNGFGSHDATRRGEFTSTIRTEQYRETLKQELRVHEKQRDPESERKVMAIAAEREMGRTFTEGLTETRHLYDIGKKQVTEFDPRSSRDTFYVMRKDRPKRLGAHTTSSQAVGDGAWDHKYTKPEFGPIPYVKNFYDRSHLQIEG
uniref:Uncharacterized protein n=1 Tax=Fibrocapsa japonica TaxID=94617 RepID=A0A7S2XZN8_9STRA|mmetsp:Transcript_4257/g.6364  ORF Transcript_4257/g.6364 Transcript_4257/m.6364 type:complete len:225 (+) Transcript_4257:151-825(+)|eukprot:CAMPEP_0113943598 /NCGR_PEP_ID=MMETSP1339-20121228/26795_1 /TAXON_ID=94617 /ORGANISM="Fibrocapsa japonica" /LENGTH=224 /DNA_ID=CAMNT_0000948507 /DNA_START=143 /DNA_END=817 /DNA_ORIENTATION=- /assembly_acc=CAM_ASM_000762